MLLELNGGALLRSVSSLSSWEEATACVEGVCWRAVQGGPRAASAVDSAGDGRCQMCAWGEGGGGAGA